MTGANMMMFESGATLCDADELVEKTASLKCPIDPQNVMYYPGRTVETVDPVAYTACGVTSTVFKAPSKVVTMNQGVTEFMLAMGLGDKLAGTAYLDDAIWPRYKAEYEKIPVLSDGYPTEDEIMAVSPDFIVGSYKSAFREQSCETKDGETK